MERLSGVKKAATRGLERLNSLPGPVRVVEFAGSFALLQVAYALKDSPLQTPLAGLAAIAFVHSLLGPAFSPKK